MCRVILFFHSFKRGVNWRSEILKNLSKVTQLVVAKLEVKSESARLQRGPANTGIGCKCLRSPFSQWAKTVVLCSGYIWNPVPQQWCLSGQRSLRPPFEVFIVFRRVNSFFLVQSMNIDALWKFGTKYEEFAFCIGEAILPTQNSWIIIWIAKDTKPV